MGNSLDVTARLRSAGHMERKDRLDSFGVIAMLGFATVFAFNQVAIKVTNGGLNPIFAAGLRSAIGLVALTIWVQWSKPPMRLTPAQKWSGLLVGALFTFEFFCIFWALDITSVSRASVIFYTMPIWLGLVAHFVLPGERLTGMRLLGFLLAIAGVALAFADRQDGTASFLGDVLALFAALSWAGIALTVRLTPIKDASAEAQLACQLGLSAIVFLAVAPSFGPLVRDFAPVHAGWLGYQSLVTVMIGFLLWFRMMKIYPASDIAAFSFLSPVLSVVLGWWFLAEHISAQILVSLGFVCVGLVLISRRK